MRLRFVLLFAFCALLPRLEAEDLQNRTVVKLALDVNDHWYIPVYSISNFKTQSPHNTNIFAGIGFREENWWVEGLIQKQFYGTRLFATDVRLRAKTSKRTSLYIEPAVIISPTPAFYEFVIMEERIWKGLSLRQETENIHRSGADYLTAGPLGVSYAWGKRWDFDWATAAVYRWRPGTAKNEVRVYLNLTRRIALTDR